MRGARAAIQIRGVYPQRLAHDLANRHARIEASERVLEDDLQIPSQRAQRTFGQLPERLPHPHDATGGGSQQLQRGAHEGRLAAAGFTHHAERLAGVQLQTHCAHGREPTEAHCKVGQRKGRYPRSCGGPGSLAGGIGAGVQARRVAHQCAGVGIARGLEDRRDRARLDDASGAQDRDAVGDAGHRSQVVGDEHHGHGALALELGEQREDLRLDGDIQ